MTNGLQHHHVRGCELEGEGRSGAEVEVEVRRSDYDLQLHKGPASVGSHGRRHRRVEMVRMG